MKLDMIKVVAVAGVTAALIVGCSTPTIPITMNVAGEVKLTGVNKIAIADFNSLPGDPFSGTMAADAETCALVKRAVASAFYTSPTYQIADLETEKAIGDENGKSVKRYDAVIYGRLWWNITPVTNGKYPHKFTLESWDNVPYTKKNPLTGKDEQLIAHVTKQRKDVIEMLDYRVQNATLMLTLSIYRLDGQGQLKKIVDTYQVTNEGFTLMNGTMKVDCASVGIKDDNAVTRLQATGNKEETRTAYEEMFVQKALSLNDVGAAAGQAAAALTSGLTGGLGGALAGGKDDQKKEDAKPASNRKVDANGKLILRQETVAMPSELQAKLMLASSISKSLAAKLAPTKTTFNVPADLGDARLENLLKNGAFKSAHDYSLYMLRQKLGRQICEKLVQFLPEFGEACSYPVPDSSEQIEGYNEALIDELLKGDFNIYFYTLGTAHAAAIALEGAAQYNDKMIEYLAGEKLDIYFYALGICHEAMQQMLEAEEYYRFAFNVKPSMNYALGISRVFLAGSEESRLSQTKEAKAGK
jgi:tetratricopeptide (TPR) repeat protein